MKKIFLAIVLFAGIGFTASAQSNENVTPATAPAAEVTPVTPVSPATAVAPVVAAEPAAVKSCCSSKKGKETASAKACCADGKKSKASCGDKKEETTIAQ